MSSSRYFGTVSVFLFLGNTVVDQPKGIHVVKEGIRKLKFSQQLKKSEGGKTPKVELTISVDGVAIQDIKTKRIFHQFPLHQISYCADDKSDKKFFTFIAKEENSKKHNCFVFVSEKLAEEITLTIGQAFDLAYRQFLETSGKDLEMKRQQMILQKRIQELETENANLRGKLQQLQPEQKQNGIPKNNSENSSFVIVNEKTTSSLEEKTKPIPPSIQPPPSVPRRNIERTLSKSQNFLIEFTELPSDGIGDNKTSNNINFGEFEDFNPREEQDKMNGNGHLENGVHEKDVFTPIPFSSPQSDPFGMGDFQPSFLDTKELETAIGAIDKRLSEMRVGFSRGLSFGNDDFSLETLDPLYNKTS
ncbi:PTB domain-containing engulfment adapter protein 1-like isoform X2 [Limulus polyphemus]|uniref:PTB domain-containing engulfment adapter protein 1-like isoform X2 n=1 Tax=Limulus polyphemus TaxID=6850 RepID=A0ABM1B3I4_LIMPO|nr:PTB domain-containing engulfment adapter protein 1-like isoform X2 [Limulus polyphemus]